MSIVLRLGSGELKMGRKSFAKISIALILATMLLAFFARYVVPNMAEGGALGTQLPQYVGVNEHVDVLLNAPTTSTTTTTSPPAQIIFNRSLDCPRCGDHKAPPVSDVNVTITAAISAPAQDGVLADYYPVEWTVLDANGGTTDNFNLTHAVIRWRVGYVEGSVSRSYVILSPPGTTPPTKYDFFSELAGAWSEPWTVIVSDANYKMKGPNSCGFYAGTSGTCSPLSTFCTAGQVASGSATCTQNGAGSCGTGYCAICGDCAGGSDTCSAKACGTTGYNCAGGSVCSGQGTGAGNCAAPGGTGATCYCAAMCTSNSCVSNKCAAASVTYISNATQTLSMSPRTDRDSVLIRQKSQSLTATGLGGRMNSAIRAAAQSFALNDLYGKSKVLLTTLQEAFSMSSAVGNMQSLLRGIPQSLSTNGLAARMSQAVRNVAESIAGNSIAQRFETFFKSLSQSFAFQSAAGAVGTVVRTIAQALSADSAVGRLIAGVRGVVGQLSLSDMAQRTALLIKGVSEAFGETTAISRIPTFVRTLSQQLAFVLSDIEEKIEKTFQLYPALSSLSIGIADSVGRIVSAARTTVQSAALELALSRIAVGIRSAAQQLSASDAALRVFTAIRNLAQNASVSQMLARMSSAFRSAAQSAALADLVQKLRLASSTLTQAFGMSEMAGRGAGILRAVAQMASIDTLLAKLRYVPMQVQQTIASSAITGRLSSLFRMLSQSMDVPQIAGKAAAAVRLLTQYLSASSFVARMGEMSRSISQALLSNNLSARLESVARAISQAISPSSFVAKLRSTFSFVAQSFGFGTLTGRLGVIARAVAQSVTENALYERFRVASIQVLQAFNWNTATARGFSLIRYVSQSFGTQQLAARISGSLRFGSAYLNVSDFTNQLRASIRSISDGLSLAGFAARIGQIARSASEYASLGSLSARLRTIPIQLLQAISGNTAVIRASSLLRSMMQGISPNDIAARLSMFARTLSQFTTFSQQLYYGTLRSYEAFVSLAVSFTGATGRLVAALRTLPQAMIENTVTSRFGLLARAIAQSLADNAFAQSAAALLRAVSQALSAGADLRHIMTMVRLSLQGSQLSDAAIRIGTLARDVGQSLSYSALVSRLSQMTRAVAQGIAQTQQLSEISYRLYTQLANLALSITSSGARLAAVARVAAQALNSNLMLSRFAALVKAVSQSLDMSSIAGRMSAAIRAASQQLGIGELMEYSSGLTFSRIATAYMSLMDSVGRSMSVFRSAAQYANLNGMAARAADVLRYVTQGLAEALRTNIAANELYEVVSTAVLQMAGTAGRMLSALSSVAQSVTANLSLARLFSGLRVSAGQVNLGNAAARLGYIARAVMQSLSAAPESFKSFITSRSAFVGLALNNVLARMALMARTGAQSISAMDVARLPYNLFQRMSAIALSLMEAFNRMRMTGAVVTQPVSFAGFASRLAAMSRAVSQSISISSMASRAASFSRSVYAAITAMFNLFFRLPPWFYQTQPSCSAAGYYWCSGTCAATSCDTTHNVTYSNITAFAVKEINVTVTSVDVSLMTNSTLDGVALETWSYVDTPVAATLASDTDTQAVRYFNVSANSTLNSTVTPWILMKFGYTDADLQADGLSESTLSLYEYSDSLGKWVQLTNSSTDVFGTGVDTSAKYVWTNKTSMSIYAIGGLYANGQSCSAGAECYSNTCCAGTCQSSCAVAPTNPPAAGPSGTFGGSALSIIPPAESVVKYEKIAVLREAAPGQTIVVGVEVKNTGLASQKDLALNVSGVPADWITASVHGFSLKPSETRGFNIAVTPPADAKAGDYMVALKLKNSGVEADDFFMVRLSAVPADYDRPVVSREVSIDRVAGRTDVSILVNNQYKDYKSVDVTESIPKELANSTDYVTFGTSPSKVLRNDPIVLWSIPDMAAGTSKNISYSVPKILDEYTPYLYWPVRQLDVVSATAPSTMKITGFTVPYFTPGSASDVSFTVQNLDSASHNFTFSMELPDGWTMAPESAEKTLASGQEEQFRFEINAPAGTQAGNYMVRAVFGWDGTYVVKEYVAQTTAFEMSMVLIVGAAAIFIVGAVAGYKLTRSEKPQLYVSTREERLRRIKSAISTTWPQQERYDAMKLELRDIGKLKKELKPVAMLEKNSSNKVAAIERLKKSMKGIRDTPGI